MEQVKGWIQLVRDTVDQGSHTVEDIHRNLAERPLDVMTNIGLPADPIERLRTIQDEVLGNTYDTIREVNIQVSGLLLDLVNKDSAS